MTKQTQRTAKPTEDQGLEPDSKLFAKPGKTDVNLRTKRTKVEDPVAERSNAFRELAELKDQIDALTSRYDELRDSTFTEPLKSLNEEGEKPHIWDDEHNHKVVLVQRVTRSYPLLDARIKRHTTMTNNLNAAKKQAVKDGESKVVSTKYSVRYE